MTRSLYVVKPEAMTERSEIHQVIHASGLRIVRTAVAVVPSAVLDVVYGDLSADLRRATELYMGSAECEIGEVVGPEAVRRLLVICGESVDPSLCGPDTIRARFGVRQPERVGKAAYFRNAIHRPRTDVEAERDLELLGRFLHG